jgi:phosphohistidine phosphatase
MKILYLVRHAKSSWKFPELSDHDRPLNKRGKRDAPDMANRLKSKGVLPDTLISSTANRAYTTAQNIAKGIGFSAAEIIPNSDLFHAESSEIIEVIQGINNTHESAMIFGHNPGFTTTANRLINLGIDNIPTCGVLVISFAVDSWSEIDSNKGELVFYDYPKKVIL